MRTFVKSFEKLKIIHDIELAKEIQNPVITIGTFDGVHIGHQKIIEQLNHEAELINGESVLLTFFPHPRMIINPKNHGLKLIQTQNEKIDKLTRQDLQNCIVYPFTKEFSELSAYDFVKTILVEKLHVKKLIIGYDHQFGKNREGSIEYLKKLSTEFNFQVIEIPAQEIDAINVSSTKIREALVSGNIELANEYLVEPFEISGTVVHGRALGRTIGFPTANILLNSDLKLIPGNGVYAVKIILNNELLDGMLNIGVRPTVDDSESKTIEVHIFDFNKDIYGQDLTVHFLSKVRDEKKFDGIEALTNQLKKDEEIIRAVLSNSF